MRSSVGVGLSAAGGDTRGTPATGPAPLSLPELRLGPRSGVQHLLSSPPPQTEGAEPVCGPPSKLRTIVLKCRFCRSCIAASLKSSRWTCPYCRAYLPSEGVPATDVARRMKAEYRNCAECDTLVCLSEMRAHIRTCEKYIDTYGPLQELEETTTRCVCPFCQRELDEDSLLDHCITHHRSERRPVMNNVVSAPDAHLNQSASILV
ncbi:E3 ubiquitin-protein ligase RNF125 [Octodon degus]|uniref:RING-type E3 ubiquitin transferase n=1 Tax=Octodon degus TaxID=10160 RepID=A0A6P3VAC9_OCTDE|nr:E3 ubiquitin-protein ligase RNF125 [Octodon degus]